MKLFFTLLGLTPTMSYIISYPHQKTLATIYVSVHITSLTLQEPVNEQNYLTRMLFSDMY